MLKFGMVRKHSAGRMLAAEIHCNSFVFQVISIYAFSSETKTGNSSSPKQKLENFFNEIYIYKSLDIAIILTGDFNAVKNSILDRCPFKNKYDAH